MKYIFVWLLLASLIFIGCKGTNAIRKNGLNYVQIGDHMPAKDQNPWNGFERKDSLMEQGGFKWQTVYLKYPDGSVILEEDFEGSGSVNRIRVETPSLYAPRKIRVGMSIQDLKRQGNLFDILYLADYQLFDVILSRRPGIHYLVHDPEAAAQITGNTVTIDQLSDTAKIVSIVIM